jgi:transcriptional regulator with XRE-family HTH domain
LRIIGNLFMDDSVSLLAPAQCRAARALLGWSRKDLAIRSGVAERTLVDFEGGLRQPHSRTIRDIRSTLENGGVEFLMSGDNHGEGLRFCTKIE